MIATIFIMIIVALVAVFSVQNAAPVTISFLHWKFEASLAIVIILSMISGMIIGALISSILRFKDLWEETEPPTL